MVKNNYKLIQFSSSEELSKTLCKEIIDVLVNEISTKGYASLVVSGGSTPKQLFATLSKVDIAWEKVYITLVDERWVDSTNTQSNERLVRDYLLQNYAKNAQFIPLKTDKIHASDSIESLEVKLDKFSDELDIVILGMGLDAHTASFFPHTNELHHALETNDLICATLSINEPKERITLSRNYLLRAKNLFLHIEGKEKKDVFFEASQSDNIVQMPIISMMQQEKPLMKVYYAD